jgi:cyclopropane-fatty-acyl-phospholipid synthase
MIQVISTLGSFSYFNFDITSLQIDLIMKTLAPEKVVKKNLSRPQKRIQTLLDRADIKINGPNPWDIQVHNEQFYQRVISNGSIGLGESYMDGWWDVEQLDQFFYRALRANLDKRIRLNWGWISLYLRSVFLNMQTLVRSRKVAREHYDRDNDLYMSFLDPYNQYSCGYFDQTEDLNEAQLKKLDLICRKLQLKEEDHVLDIGCGWGGFAKFAASRYGCKVTAITISEQGANYASELCEGLPVTVLKKDYRALDQRYSKIMSCGMFEHVGYKNYRTFMKVVSRCLEKDGLFLLHTIGRNASVYSTDPWIAKYIFPNSMIPSAKQIGNAIDDLFVMEDWHNFGIYYAKTLRAWMNNFNDSWEGLKMKYDNRFYRMWKYYLLSCAGTFEARRNQLWQIVLSSNGVKGGHKSIR